MTMKTKRPTFYEILPGYLRAVIYSEEIATWVEVIVFEEDGVWKVNYESKDPSESIHSCASEEEAIEWVCAYHKQSVRNTFIAG